ncbi:pseudouridine synthase [Fibrobacter sp.]|uniref:pseudouridine synthase n=1 Tax=Fibrobacter sp. TaxID=35828 RepID=UPI00386DF04D
MAFYNRNKPQKQGAHGVARVISKRGYCSRSQAEKLVKEGRVTLRGKVVFDIDTPTYENDEILVDGNKIEANAKVYFAMNKPRGIVTTASDEKGRKTVMDLFREQFTKMYPGKQMPHISPVGRLDAASEGLLLFTNDTQWADEQLTSPTHKKIYRVQVSGKPTGEELAQMEKGFNVAPRVFGEKEEFMHAERVTLLSEGEKNCWLEFTLTEGKNREIRRMLAHLGYEVMRLMRIQFDKYVLGDLKPGEIKVIQT